MSNNNDKNQDDGNAFYASAFVAAPTDSTTSASGGSPFSGWASNNGSGNAPSQQTIQDQQQKSIADLLNVLIGSGGNVISVPSLVAQLQSRLAPSPVSEQPAQPGNNDVLIQQLQELIQSSNNTAAARIDTDTQSTPQEHPEDMKPAAAGVQTFSEPASMQTGSDDSPPVIIVPCRARGMDADHTAATAYFSIPHNVKHGGNLFCSHQGCRDDGIKFAYCSHCGIPVAKRNFRQRHDHTGELQEKIKRRRGASAHANSVGLKQPPSALPWNDGLESSRNVQGSRDQRVPMSLSFRKKQENVTNSSESEPQRNVTNSSGSDGFDRFKIDKEIQNAWTSLLSRRPQGEISGDDISRWLLSVLEVSNLDETARKIITSTGGLLTREALERRDRDGKTYASAGFGMNRNGCSEPSEASTFGNSEGLSSESSGSQEAESPSDSNEYNKFLNKSQLIQSGVMKAQSSLSRPFGESTESSGPTDQSGGLSTSASNPTTSGSGSGGSSSDSENGFTHRGPIPSNRKSASSNDDSTSSGSGSNVTGGSSSDSENGFNDNLQESTPKGLKRASANDDPTTSGSGTNSSGPFSTDSDSDSGSSNGRDGPTSNSMMRASASSKSNGESQKPPMKKRKL